MKVKFTKAFSGYAKGDVVNTGNEVWAKYLVQKGIAKESDDALTKTVKEKNDNAGPNPKVK